MNDLPGNSSVPLETVRWRGLNQRNQTAYVYLEDGDQQEIRVTYGELDLKARAIAAALQEKEVFGEPVLLLYPPGLEYLFALFACLYAGAIAVPVFPPDPTRFSQTLPRFKAILEDSKTKLCLTTQAVLTFIESFPTRQTLFGKLQWMATDTILDTQADHWKSPSVNENTLVFLQYTSGSTGTPKGVMINNANLNSTAVMTRKTMNPGKESVMVSWLPLYHDFGLIGQVLACMYLGCPLIFMPPTLFLHQPIRWLKAISRYKANISAGPNFAYDLCVRSVKPEQRAALDLTSWEYAYCGSEPIRAQTIRDFCKYFEPCGFSPKAFYPCYGLSEATLMVTAGTPHTAPVIKKFKNSSLKKNQGAPWKPGDGEYRELVACGAPIGDLKVVIVDPKSRKQVPNGQVGEIWVKGGMVALGYWNRPEETQKTFYAVLQDTGEGDFLRTGDLGFLTPEGLFITGRLKDMIILLGQNFYPQDIEVYVEDCHPAVRKGCGAAFSLDLEGEERLVIAQEVNECSNAALKDIEKAIRMNVVQNVGAEVYKIFLMPPDTLPKTAIGKIRRQPCKEAFLSGTLEILNQ